MSGFLIAPTFNPPQQPITVPIANVGYTLQILAGGRVGFAPAAGGSGSLLGAGIAYAPPAGSITPAPAGFTSSVGRIYITLAGDTTFNSWPAGVNGQQLFYPNADDPSA